MAERGLRAGSGRGSSGFRARLGEFGLDGVARARHFELLEDRERGGEVAVAEAGFVAPGLFCDPFCGGSARSGRKRQTVAHRFKGERPMMLSRFLLIAAAAVPLALGQASTKGVSLANLPLSFEPNVGQTDGSVRFFARSQGMNVFFTDHEVLMDLHQRLVRMRLAGGRAPITARGVDPQPGISNYYIGNDPKDWHTGVAHYGRVSFTGVYDGVDLISYGNQRNLEYDFIVAPGAEPSQIRLAFDGMDSMSVNASGDLVLRTPGGEIVQKRPVAYQDTANGRVEVGARYVVSGDRQVHFELARYDRQRALVIDPMLSYSTYLAGTGYDEAWGVAVDLYGSAYVTGYTSSADFARTTTGKIGSDDAFVSKLSPGGNSVVYTTFIGGGANDHGYAIAVDMSGSAYITGATQSSARGLPQIGSPQPAFGGGFWDAFAAKLGASGLVLYSMYLGGSGDEAGWGIAVDGSGNAYVTGDTTSTNFPVTPGAFQTSNHGSNDGFVVKIGARGGRPFYSTYLGGMDQDVSRGIAVDAAGSAFIAGYTYSSNFPAVSPAQTCQASANFSDAFVTKLNPQGQAAVYSTCLGGTSSDQGFGIAVDSAGSAYVTGSTKSADFPVTTYFQRFLNGNNPASTSSDAFVTKLSPAGNTLVYSSFLGGGGTEIGRGIAVDSTGAAYVAGWTDSTDFPVAFALQSSNAGGQDGFVASVNPAGTALAYSTYLGGVETDNALAIAVDVTGEAFVAGVTYSNSSTPSAAFPTTAGAFQASAPFLNNHNDSNGFVTKFTGSLVPNGATMYAPVSGLPIVVQAGTPLEAGFAWNPVNGAASYRLDVGSTCGATNFYSQNEGRSTSDTVSIPSGTLSMCARLTTFFGTLAVHYDYGYRIVWTFPPPPRR
jgi:Beta-propeller repeat